MSFRRIWARCALLLGMAFALNGHGAQPGEVDPRYLPAFARTLDRARQEHAAASPHWLSLLHYQKTSLGTLKSDVDTENFFFSKNGRRDPESEFEATLKAFFVSGAFNQEDQHPRCLFPARARFIAERFGIGAEEWPAADCSRFEVFRRRIGAKSASLVFSSYYLNNPSSSLGHLLLRLEHQASVGQERAELLDYGINYAADVDTKNPVLYAIRGFLGYFRGSFTSMPYYYKVREYNDFESRDLWEYNLSLDAEEVDRIVAHLWELGPVSIDYYYFDENCATHILTLLDAVKPSLRLAARLPSGIVMPTDAVRVVAETPGLVRSVQYRPSLLSLLYRRYEALSPAERLAMHRLSQGESVESVLKEWNAEARARILDTALDDLDSREAKALLANEDGPEARRRQELLIARAVTGVTTPTLNFPNAESILGPHRGHPARRISLYGGTGSEGGYGGLALRMGFHQRLDRPAGRFDSADIEFLTFRIRRELRAHRWSLDELKIVDLLSLSDLASLRPSLSWGFRMGFKRFKESSCAACTGASVEGGIGAAWNAMRGDQITSPGIWVFSLIEPRFSLVPSRTTNAARLDLVPRVGMLARLSSSLAVEGGLEYSLALWDSRPTWGTQVRTRWHQQNNWSFDLAWRKNSFGHEFESALGYDF